METTIVMCDGPACSVQKEKESLGHDTWIDVHDWSDRPSIRLHFCSWVCLDQFSDVKVAGRWTTN